MRPWFWRALCSICFITYFSIFCSFFWFSKELVSYCARDVAMTRDLLCAVFPHFLEHCPHAVTLAGMFEMGSAYLPLRAIRWKEFVESADNTAQELEREVKEKLMSLANKACQDFAKEGRCSVDHCTCFRIVSKSFHGHVLGSLLFQLLVFCVVSVWKCTVPCILHSQNICVNISC